MPRVLALTRYDDLGASSRVRFLQYIPHLERLGLSVTVQPLLPNDHLRRFYRDGRRSAGDLIAALGGRFTAVLQKNRADVVWLQQEIFPYLPATVETALLSGRPYVIDFDDAFHLYYEQGPVRALYGGKIARLMRHAAAVVVGSDVMAAYARDAGARAVHIVPSAVDTGRFTKVAAAGPVRSPFRLGWIGTPLTAMQSLYVLQEPLKQAMAETGAQAVFMGMDRDQFPDIPGERLPWSEAGEEAFLSTISAGLCPLDDSPWTRGKSGYKIIQYMSAGRPTLTSPVGIAAQLVEPGVTGFHCATADDWYRHVKTLAQDAELCARMGREARARAETRYDTVIAAADLHRIITAALK